MCVYIYKKDWRSDGGKLESAGCGHDVDVVEYRVDNVLGSAGIGLILKRSWLG